MVQKLIELPIETEKPIITVRKFNTSLPIVSRKSRHKIGKDLGDLNNAISQLDLTDINRTLQNMEKQNSTKGRIHIQTYMGHLPIWIIF